MTQLSSFGDNATVAIVGASGGIGQAFCRLLTSDDHVEAVYALSRSPLEFQHDKITAHDIDIEDEASVKAAADALADVEFDLVLVLTGILHQGDSLQPERRLSELTPQEPAQGLRGEHHRTGDGGQALYSKVKTPHKERFRSTFCPCRQYFRQSPRRLGFLSILESCAESDPADNFHRTCAQCKALGRRRSASRYRQYRAFKALHRPHTAREIVYAQTIRRLPAQGHRRTHARRQRRFLCLGRAEDRILDRLY